jgi:hypothetical protein
MMPLSTSFFSNASRYLVAGLAGLILAACGGGGGSPGITVGTGTTGGTSGSGSGTGTTTTAKSPTIAVELIDASGTAKTSVTSANPVTVRATLLDEKGAPIPNTIVTFAEKAGFTTLAPTAGTGLTDASGIATVTMAVKDLATAQAQAGAADTISAAATVGTVAVTDSKSFSIGTTAITLKLIEPSPSTTSLTAYGTTAIKVDVLVDGAVYTAQPVTVNFTSACAGTKADLPASATTINGRAQVVYRDKGCSATDTVTASVSGAQPITATLNVAAPAAASIGFVSATPSDKAIVIQGAGGKGRSETAILTFKALDTFGQPLPNQIVNFSVNSTQPVTLQSTSATTGTDGTVVVAVNSGTAPTTFRVIATLATGQTTISDTITVTTGQPIQAAFSLSADKYNIEGWDHDDEHATITALLADAFGNPVADGTPVVFQTDSGAVGSSSSGGCVTQNGGCSVTFRSQNPRYGVGNAAGKRAGLATISVSTTSALYTLSGQIGVYMSGSTGQEPLNVYQGNTLLTSSTSLTTTLCSNYALILQINDVNFNPLPVGTTIASANADKVSIGTIVPATVASTAPATLTVASMAARQGTPHFIPVKPDSSCVEGGATTGKGTFDIVITSPKGVATYYSFSLTYPKL